jgi:hypothetical protein
MLLDNTKHIYKVNLLQPPSIPLPLKNSFGLQGCMNLHLSRVNNFSQINLEKNGSARPARRAVGSVRGP